jgi:hypothetical protein
MCPGCPAHWQLLKDNPHFHVTYFPSLPKGNHIHDLHQRAVAGAMEKKSPDKGDIFPGLAFVERCD